MNADSPPRDLEQIQRWMQAVITHPAGVEGGLGSPEARSQIDVPPADVARVVDPSSKRSSVERLGVYANAYFARLVECLRDEFPALVHAAGEDVFDGLAFEYLLKYPSTSYTLGELGKRFPLFLEETRPQDEGEAGGPSWPDFMIDLARLERTYAEVFDGPGAETVRPMTAGDVSRVPADEAAQARLVPVPCLRLLALHYPVHEYATGVRKKENPSMPEPHPTWLAISRIDYVVRRWTLTEGQFALLGGLIAGDRIGEAIERAAFTAVEPRDDMETLARNVRDWFEEWAAAGFFQAIDLPQQ